MNPIAVRREDTGETIGYLCGVCGYPQTIHSMDGAWALDHSQAQAESCCRCHSCDEPLTGNRKTFFRGLFCPPCSARSEAESKVHAAQLQQEHAVREAENQGALAKCADAQIAQLLLLEMQDWSEEHWAAGWLSGLEYTLWRDRSENARFRKMGKSCGGWWIYDRGPKFVLLPEWAEMFAKWERQYGGSGDRGSG